MSPTVTAATTASRLLSAGVLALSAALLAPAAALGQDGAVEAPHPDTQTIQVEGEARGPAYVGALDGQARLDREGGTQAAEPGMPLVPGDRLRTDAGRVEIVFPSGSQVYVDRYSELEIQADTILRLARGRLLVRVASSVAEADRPVIDAPGAAVEFHDGGEYRVSIGGTDAVEVELVVLRGLAALLTEHGNALVEPSHHAVARDGGAPSTPEWLNPGETALERWAAERASLWESGQYTSRQYLPSELDSYAATFDRHGTWQNDETYGSVWYPASTDEEWRPYYDGRWDYTSHYGWTWVAGGAIWTYPTHHYGRWHVGPRGWFWIPSRHWGPAWVYWAVSSDYVGWCPLGWNGRPVVSVFHYDKHYPTRWRDPYRAWTVSTRGAFGRGGPASYADRGRLGRERPAFVLQHRAPGFAPPRSPYPSPFNTRLNDGTYRTERRTSRGGVSTMSPRAYGPQGSTDEQRGGYAAPRGAASERGAADSSYERARGYMRRPERPVGDGATYRRVPSNDSPVRAPGGLWRARDRDGDRDEGRGGAGYAGPGYRAPDSPGMSRRPERDRSPGISDPAPGSRAVPRYDPPSRRDSDGERSSGSSGASGRDGGTGDSDARDSGARDSGARDGGARDSGARDSGARDNGGASRATSGGGRGGDGGGSRGGAVRRHP